MPPAAEAFVGVVNGEPVCHVVFTPLFTAYVFRATRLVVMPEWQGAGVGTKFIEWLCQYHAEGNGRTGRKLPTLFHTSHPQLCAFFRRSPMWVQKSLSLYGTNKNRSRGTIQATEGNKISGSGYGGHFRAVQGFKYLGPPRPKPTPDQGAG